jgi:hypothetical protein
MSIFVKIIMVTNVTVLSVPPPTSVELTISVTNLDGYNLIVGDDVCLNGQTIPSQNGIYNVV